MESCNVRAYAKINLSLTVIGKRDDGYHIIRSRMQAISLHDDVIVEKADGRSGIAVSAAPAPGARYDDCALPQGEDNLAYAAAKLSLNLWGGEDGASPRVGARITIRKRIPMAAGLAGGSSDAAAVMLALARMLAPDVSLGGIIKAGARIGADVPFCVAAIARTNPLMGYSGDAAARSSALCEGIGDELSQAAPVRGWAVIIKPAVEVSTPVIYSDWDDLSAMAQKQEAVSGCDDPARRQGCGTAPGDNDPAPLPGCETVSGDNDLAAAAIRRHPLIEDILEETRSIAGADKVFMTGSGPTVVALYSDEAEASRGCSVLDAKYKNRADIDAVILSKLL
jgi:4-diphosphocytidyl-2-C-methyl-D-erythritol kinase